MNIFLTSGTIGFMETLQKQFANEEMIVMHGANNSILLHETMGKTLFQTPRRYQVISSSGTLQQQGFFALNNIPVTDEGRPIFEHRFHNHADTISASSGLIAHRLLRPLNSDTYIVLTQWTEKNSFELWKNSSVYTDIHTNNKSGVVLDKTLHIFSSAAYLMTYKAISEEEE